jgi:ribose 5-phosphate isomerase B
VRIYIGADHRGFALKNDIVKYLREQGHDVSDQGEAELDPNDDYPQFAGKVCSQVLASSNKDARGILLCGSGQGICMAANRFKGIRAALGYSNKAARLARNDDDSNVLCLPADLLNKEDAMKIVDTWLNTPFAAATRYLRRIKEMDELG